jgi:hypothetical protein
MLVTVLKRYDILQTLSVPAPYTVAYKEGDDIWLNLSTK